MTRNVKDSWNRPVWEATSYVLDKISQHCFPLCFFVFNFISPAFACIYKSEKIYLFKLEVNKYTHRSEQGSRWACWEKEGVRAWQQLLRFTIGFAHVDLSGVYGVSQMGFVCSTLDLLRLAHPNVYWKRRTTCEVQEERFWCSDVQCTKELCFRFFFMNWLIDLIGC